MGTSDSSRRALQRWYDDMWGKCANHLIPQFTTPTYLRHDLTGANNAITSEQYRDLVGTVIEGEKVTEFTYFVVAEGEFAATLGCYVLTKGRQWDWVQLFRVKRDRLAETWLPGMGGTDPFGLPKAENTWTGTEVPDPIPATPNKHSVQNFYEKLCIEGDWSQSDRILSPQVRIHDTDAADITLKRDEFLQRIKNKINGSTITDFKLFTIEEKDICVSTASWIIDGERQWDWVQAFRLKDGLICQTWLPVIGGNDRSIVHGPDTKWNSAILPESSVRVDCSGN